MFASRFIVRFAWSPDARSLAWILRGQVLAAQDDVKF
jgi:hypothetical protein